MNSSLSNWIRFWFSDGNDRKYDKICNFYHRSLSCALHRYQRNSLLYEWSRWGTQRTGKKTYRQNPSLTRHPPLFWVNTQCYRSLGICYVKKSLTDLWEIFLSFIFLLEFFKSYFPYHGTSMRTTRTVITDRVSE